MNFFNEIVKKLRGSSLLELIIALLIAMIIFYMSMSILLKFNYNHLFRNEQLLLLEYNPKMLNDYNLLNNRIFTEGTSLKWTLDSSNYHNSSSLTMKNLKILDSKGRLVFKINTVVKE